MNESLKEELKNRLDDMPQKIFDREIELLNKTDEYEEQVLRVKYFEQKISSDVSEEKEDGKSVFSNKEKRDAEIKRRLSSDSNYKNLSEEVKALKRELETDKLAISFLKRKLKATESLIDLVKL